MTKRKTGILRIIGGQLRSRRIALPPTSLRPTPDRVRETLFNWLMPYVHGRRCLDLFAGSGILSFEALSRGASHALLVDSDPKAIAQIQENARTLELAVETACTKLPAMLSDAKAPFDLIFCDPPYHRDLVGPCLDMLFSQKLLAPNALLYLEHEAGLEITHPQVTAHKSKSFGHVCANLCRILPEQG